MRPRIIGQFLQTRHNPKLHLAFQLSENLGSAAAQFNSVARRHSEPQFLDKSRQRDGAVGSDIATRFAHVLQIHTFIQGSKQWGMQEDLKNLPNPPFAKEEAMHASQHAYDYPALKYP